MAQTEAGWQAGAPLAGTPAQLEKGPGPCTLTRKLVGMTVEPT